LFFWVLFSAIYAQTWQESTENVDDFTPIIDLGLSNIPYNISTYQNQSSIYFMNNNPLCEIKVKHV